jgi:hypothetical protein
VRGVVSTWLLRIGAAGFLILGIVSFIAPGWASQNFPWAVGPFLAMTIGGWSLGTAGFALLAARDARPDRTYPLLVYVWLFGAGQLVVAIAFADRLQLAAPLTYPYLVGLVGLVASAPFILADWTSRGVDLRGGPGRIPIWARGTAVVFVVFVAALAVATLRASGDGAAARGEFVPEQMGLFAIRAFAAFFVALAASALSLLAARSLRPYDALALAGLYLIVPITLAALANIGLFDFVSRPGSLLYLAAYVVVGILLAVRLFGPGRRARAAAASAADAPAA